MVPTRPHCGSAAGQRRNVRRFLRQRSSSMASKEDAAVLEDENWEGSVAALMKEPPALPPERPGSWAKDHCDFLLDSIDAQLGHLQAERPSVEIKDSSDNRMASRDRTEGTSIAADLGLGGSGGRNGDASLGEDSSFWKEECTWWLLAHSPDSDCPPGGQSESDSVRTEDFAAKFKEGLVDPLWSSHEEEDAFASGGLSGDFGPLEPTAHNQIGFSQPLVGLEAAAGSQAVDLENGQDVPQPRKEASQGDMGPVFTDVSGEPLSQCVWNRIRSSESLGQKTSQLSQECCKETAGIPMGTIRDCSAWNGILWHGSVGLEKSLGLEIGNDGEQSALLESQQGREEAEVSFECVRDTHKNSNSPLLVEDLGPSHLLQVPRVTLKMIVSDAEGHLRTEGKRCPKGVSDIACLCTLQPPHHCELCSDGEARGGPWSLCPVIVCDANKRPKPALSRIGTNPCVAGAPGDAKRSLDLGSDGCMKQRKSQAAKAPGTRRPEGALELIECGNLGVEHHEPQRGLNKGHMECVGGRWVAGIPVKSFDDVTIDSDLDSVRTESVRGHFCRALGCQQASGRGRKFCSPQRDSRRDLGSSDTGTEEEEARDGFVKFWRRSSPKKWTLNGGADPGWKGTKRGPFRSRKASPITGHHREDPPDEDFVTDLVRLEESVLKLQQDLDVGEEKLLQKKAQIHEADMTLCGVLQKEHVALELKALQEALEDSQKEARRLELHMKENQRKVDEARADLALLEYKRDACLRELPKVEEELSMLRKQCSQYGVLQAEVSRLSTEKEALKTQVRHLEDNLSSLKHQLRKCQAEQETEEARTEQLQEVAQVASELDRRIQGLELRISALQKALSEKELELSRLRKTTSVLEAEKEALGSTMESLKQKHMSQLQGLQQRKVTEKAAKETELVQLREELRHEKQQAIQELADCTAQAKADALQEQADTFQKEIENLCKTIQDRDAELIRQKQAMQQQEQDLKRESKEMIQNSLLQEKKKWEEDTRAALQMQREALEEQHQRTRTELQEALEKERKIGFALQDKMADLNKRSQELESQICSLQREKRVAMEELQALLQEEKAEGLRRLREELEQERMREREQMRTRLQQVEEDLRLLQAKQSETSLWGQGSQAHAEWADRSLAREVALACQRLQDLLPKKAGMPSLSWMLQGSTSLLSSSRAVQALQEVSEETRRYLQDLKREMETHKRHVLQIQGEKELELRQQQEKLRLESQSALEALKERLVQEHMDDIATLQRNQLNAAGADLKLHRQLQEKDRELRAIRRNMAQWKDETACKLAHKFKEELDAELEKHLSRDKVTDFCRNTEAPESERRPIAVDRSRYHHPHSVGPALLSSAPLTSRHSFSTPKLLHHLQNQIQQPRAENVTYYRGSLDDLSSFRKDLGNACTNRKHPLSAVSSSSLLQSKGSRK